MANYLKRNSVGFLGGTFDPIHFGHLNLALEIAERAGLDKVIFCPAQISPQKRKNPPTASAEDRLKMVALAIEQIKGFELCDLEIKREGPSFTIETIRTLQQKDPKAQYHLILGGDIAKELLQWKEAKELIKLAPPFIGTRPRGEDFLPNKGVEVISIPMFDISSTTLRERLWKRYCRHLVPEAVLDYIFTHKLYC